MTECLACGLSNAKEQLFCEGCDSVLVPEESQIPREPVLMSQHTPLPHQGGPRRCGRCGSSLADGFSFCVECGTEVEGGRARLVTLTEDGSEESLWVLPDAEVVIGKDVGPLAFLDDPYISPRHCRIFFVEEKLFVEDLGSRNGVFRRLQGEVHIAPGAHFRVGLQLLRLDPMEPAPAPAADGTVIWGSPDPGYRFRLVQILEGGIPGEAFPLRAGENLVGRLSGDVVFPHDRYVSARHASIGVTPEAVRLRDLGSSNGTFVRLDAPTRLEAGDLLLLGQHLVRVDLEG